MNKKQADALQFTLLKNRLIAKKLHMPDTLYGLVHILFACIFYILGIYFLGDFPVYLSAVFFYILIVELGYISHDLLHQQYFRSVKWNNFFSYISANLLIGLSRSWWIQKHNNEHHNFTNSDIHDLDIRDYDEIFTKNPKKFPFFQKHKQILFWVATSLLYYNLILLSWKYIISHKKYLEGLLSLISFFLLPVFFIGNYGILYGFFAVSIVYVCVGMHLAFAFMVNHIGMPVIDGNTIHEYSWLELQTKTSRNISGGWFIHHVFGGLNKQIEHHLFPKIPRSRIVLVSDEVRSFCNEKGFLYHETTFSESLGEISQTLKGDLPS